jgi:hypothetical protein
MKSNNPKVNNPKVNIPSDGSPPLARSHATRSLPPIGGTQVAPDQETRGRATTTNGTTRQARDEPGRTISVAREGRTDRKRQETSTSRGAQPITHRHPPTPSSLLPTQSTRERNERRKTKKKSKTLTCLQQASPPPPADVFDEHHAQAA